MLLGALLASLLLASTASATPLTAGDVVVERDGNGTEALSSTSASVWLNEFTPTGGLAATLALPPAASGANKPLVDGGSTSSDGELTLSENGECLVTVGYDTTTGVAKVAETKASTVPRTLAAVNAKGEIDTTTALSNFANENNARSAASDKCKSLWAGGAGTKTTGGVSAATLGAGTGSQLSEAVTNVRQVEVVKGQLYASADPTKAGAVTIAKVGTGLPTAKTAAFKNLKFSKAPEQPFGYSFLTLGMGSEPDTLYVADNARGAVVKYGLSGEEWVEQGSVLVPEVTGVTANDVSGAVTIYATSAAATSNGVAGAAGTLYRISDVSGVNGTLSGVPVEIATAPANEAFRGVAFAPGTVIGSGGTPPPAPSITAAENTLPATIGDPTNRTMPIKVEDSAYAASELTVTVASSKESVAPVSGISVTGSGSERTLSVTPGAVGVSKLTLTVEAPNGVFESTQITYGVSEYQGDASDRYYSGAADAGGTVDVGDGYMLAVGDGSNVLRLYRDRISGPPVRTFDFTSELPFASTEINAHSIARAGNTLYVLGSMANTNGGEPKPARDTLFAATITGSGASTELTYLGSYTHLREDIVEWDEADGNPLGLAASAASGHAGENASGFKIEGLDFVQGSSSEAYVAFRAPLEPVGEGAGTRNLALVIPVTNFSSLPTGGPGTKATFGAPLEWNLGGLSIRQIRKNAEGEYLIVAGTADSADTLYQVWGWDGEAEDEPVLLSASIPPAAEGVWNTITSAPEPITNGSSAEIVQDDAKTVWYGAGTKNAEKGLVAGLQKSLGRLITLQIPAPGTPAAPHLSQSSTPNQGAFTLRWKPAPTLRARFTLQHQNAEGGWSTVASGLSKREYTFTAGKREAEGTWNYRVKESNETGEGEYSTESEAVKVDRTPPHAPTGHADRAPDFAGNGGWYKDSVTVSFTDNGDPTLADGSSPSGVDSATLTGPQTFESSGTHVASGTVADKVGNVSSAGTLSVKVDATAPSLSVECPATAVVGEAGIHATVTASDAESGLESDPSGSVPISTSQAGLHTVTRTAIDDVGHETTRACTTDVQYPTPGAPGLSAGTSPNRSGLFTLAWTGADPLTYLGLGYALQHRPNGGSWSTVATGIEALSYELTGTGESEGTWEYRVRGEDATHGETTEYSPASSPVVVDKTPPAAPSAKAARAPDFSGNGGWYKDSVTASFTDNGDPGLVDGSPGSGIDLSTLSKPQMFSTSGSHVASGTVADNAGNVSQPGTLSVQVDATAPSLEVKCPASAVVGQEGVSAAVSASDGESGLAGDPTGSVPIDTSHAGPVTISRTATDNVGHETTRSCTTQVLESPPELGSCTRVQAEEAGEVLVYHGAFKNSKCTQQTSGGRYEWTSGAAGSAISTSGAAVTIETAGAKLTCTAEHGTGTISTAKTLSGVELRFSGCELGAKKCTTSGRAAGEIETKPLAGELGWTLKSRGKAGLAIRPASSGPFAEYFCGSSLYTLTGGVTVPVKTNKMAVSQTLKYKGKAGVQKPTGLEGAPEGLTQTPFNEASEAATLTMTVTLTFPEALEINTSF